MAVRMLPNKRLPCEEQKTLSAGIKGRLAQMMVNMCIPASIEKLELICSSVYQPTTACNHMLGH